MKKHNTNLILVASLISLVLFVGIFVYVLNVIKNKNKHTSAVTTTLGELILEQENMGTIEKKMAELQETQKKIGGYLVDTSHVDVFVEYLEGVGVQNNVELKVNSVDKIKNQKNRILGNLSIIGSFSDVMKTIITLENAPYNIIMSSVYINKETFSSPPPSNEVMKIEVKPTTKNKVAPPPPPPPAPKSTWQVDIGFSVLSLQ